MSFEAAVPKTPTSVSPLRIQIIVPDNVGSTTMEYTWEILDQDGNRLETRAGSAIPHLTPEELQALTAMVTRWKGLQLGTLPTP